MNSPDPVTLSVLDNRFRAIVDEMGEAMLCSAYFQILNSSRDSPLRSGCARKATSAPGLAKDTRPELTDVLTASYSAGVKYMHTFLKSAKGLDSHLREVYDYDGRFSTHKEFSEKLIGMHPKAKVVVYDQQAVKADDVEKEFNAGKGIPLPEVRWRDSPGGQTSFLNIAPDPNIQPVAGSLLAHGAMPRDMMFHSLSKCAFGL